MLEIFSNNAEATLAQGSGVGDALTLISRGNFHPLDQGGFQRATITNAATPEQMEIVRILSWAGATATVERATEGTTAYAWPTGSKLSGRVTAGMLESFPQTTHWFGLPDSNVVEFGARPESGLAPKALSVRNSFTLPANASVPDGSGYTMADLPRAIETVMRSISVSVSPPAQHSAAVEYYVGDVVVPAVADGYQYVFVNNADIYGGSAIGPVTFAGDGYTMHPIYGEESLLLNGWWVPVTTPARIEGPCHDIVTEVGFVTTASGASTAAHISIGTTDDETAYLNNVAVPLHLGVLRAPIPQGTQSGADVVFKVVSEAAGGDLRGFFYARGFDIAR